jgi:hypothetical protein
MFTVLGLETEIVAELDFPDKMPKFFRASEGVFAPVPPEGTSSAFASVNVSRFPPLGMSKPQSHEHELSFPSH